MAAIHQFVAGFNAGDAISNEAVVLRDLFRAWGYDSTIFSEQRRILPELRHEAEDISGCASAIKPSDVVLLHLSIGSPVNDLFAGIQCKKAILYHNITPPEFMAGIQEQTARALARGRKQAERLADQDAVVLADSQFNADELHGWGYRNVSVFPLALDFNLLRTPPSRAVLREYDSDAATILFVGRCVPNKRIEDALHAFYYFQKYVEPNSRFIHVGSFTGTEQYHALLMTLVGDLELSNAYLPGNVTQSELSAYYRLADVFLCMSEHEGFCIPIIESMAHGVPVLAAAAGAVPETMDGAGILLREKNFDAIAELMGRVIRDNSLRKAVLDGQNARIERYASRNVERELREHLGPLLS